MMTKKEQGFTLLEVMLAVAIFSFLLLMVAQIMNGEIRMINIATRQNELEQKARTAMMHVRDELKLNRYTLFKEDTQGSGVYIKEPSQPEKCLIYIPTADVDIDNLPYGTTIYYQRNERKLWYRQGSTDYLIADNIYEIKISQDVPGRQLLKIYIHAKEDASSKTDYELLTWSRMY